jgi:transmembrane sensor
MTTKSISELLTRYSLKRCTPEEEAMVNKWFAEHGSETTDFEKMNADAQQTWIDGLYADITAVNESATKQQPTGRKISLWLRISAAAAVLVGIGIFLYALNYKSDKELLIQYADQIKPAKSAATLTLSNGKVVDLNDTKAGLVIDVKALTYIDGSKVTLPSAKEEKITKKDEAPAEPGNLAVSTPNGKQYILILPDGTKVWLNATSSLKFPSSFSTKETRSVELIGEAYFEVVKDKTHPFIVKTNTQKVEVLGTHFNINSYNTTTRTTLLEGSVKVSVSGNVNEGPDQTVLLKPGEQAVQTSGKIEVRIADFTHDIAWKEGWFNFRSASLKEVLDEAAKWYDLEVSYESGMPADRFTGKVPRTASLGTFIKMLQLSDVKFRLEGHKMIIN